MIIPAMRKTYNDRVVLDIPDIEIEDGSIVALMGDNGSGKSTLAKILAGIIPSDFGKVNTGLKVGYLPQQPYIFNLSVKNNIMQNFEGKKEDALNKCSSLMKLLEIDNLADKKAIKISGGEKAKLALCRIMMKNYDLIILDEPTAGLDTESIPKAFDLIKQSAKEMGATVIVVIHGSEYAKLIASKAIILNHSGSLKEFSNL